MQDDSIGTVLITGASAGIGATFADAIILQPSCR